MLCSYRDSIMTSQSNWYLDLKRVFVRQYDHFRGTKVGWKLNHLYVVDERRLQKDKNALPDKKTS